MLFQSTLPAWGATQIYGCAESSRIISIHAPRMGSDNSYGNPLLHVLNFNPRSPHGERRIAVRFLRLLHRFQSTLPAWGATAKATSPVGGKSYFNPRSPHGERLARRFATMGVNAISIHAPRMGSDYHSPRIVSTRFVFQSTLPAWGATAMARCRSSSCRYFNPRSPHGERQDQWIYVFDT